MSYKGKNYSYKVFQADSGEIYTIAEKGLFEAIKDKLSVINSEAWKISDHINFYVENLDNIKCKTFLRNYLGHDRFRELKDFKIE